MRSQQIPHGIAFVIAWFSLAAAVQAQYQPGPSDPTSSEYQDHFAEDGGIAATSGLINPHAWHRDGKTYVVYQGKMNAPTITANRKASVGLLMLKWE